MNIRVKLSARRGERTRFRGQFERYGRKAGYRGRELVTVLLLDIQDVADPGTPLTDHLWFNRTAEFAGLNLRSGDVLEFNARVGEYEKGYREDDEDNPKRIDYHLAYPRKVVITGHEGDCPATDAENERVLAEVAKREGDRIDRILAWKEQQGRPNAISGASAPAPAVAESAPAEPAAADSSPEFHSIFEYLRRE